MVNLVKKTPVSVGLGATVVSTTKYESFKKLENRLDTLLFGGAKVIVFSALAVLALVWISDFHPIFRVATRIGLIASLGLLAYLVMGYTALNLYKEDFLKTNRLKDFYENDSIYGSVVFTENISSRTAKEQAVGGHVYKKVKNKEVCVNGEYYDVDVLFKGDTLTNFNVYKGVVLFIAGRPTLIIEGKMKA